MQIKKAARTVIVDEKGLIALINVGDGKYFKIPGGGVEENETIKEAAKREALEEAGCEVDLIQRVGEHQFIENSSELGERAHHSVCFLAKKKGISKETRFDDWEKSNNMKLIWVTFSKALELFSSASATDSWGYEINKRDMDFVLKAKEIYELVPE